MASTAPLLLSFVTSGTFVLAAYRLSNVTDDAPVVLLAFLTLIPTLASIGVVSEGLGWSNFVQLWTAGRRTQEHTMTPANAVAAARAELSKTISERWPQHSRASLGRQYGLSHQRPEVVSSSTSGSSLYEQVKGSLKDHMFSRNMIDAPVYLMDSTTGYFLRVTQHRKLVLTLKPNASCLFYVERGKSHHWGFRSVATQRYLGQNIVQKLVATSKKLQTWESFRVLQRPGDKGINVCSPQVYLILCSARFGKGMWLANKPGPMTFATSASTCRSNSANIESNESSHREHNRTGNGSSCKRDIFLSKQFGHAIRLMYSSDLSALMAAIGETGSTSSGSRALARAQTAPHVNGGLQQQTDTMVQATMSAMDEVDDAHLGTDTDTDPASGRASSLSIVNNSDSTEMSKATGSD